MRKSYLPAALILALLVSGCAGTQMQKKQTQGVNFDPQRFLTAEAVGATEGEAKRDAMASLASVFQSRVRAETRSRANSYLTAEQGEEFEKQVQQMVLIDTDVQLEGASIGWVRPDEPAGGFRALAVLNRARAAARWRNALNRNQMAFSAGLQSLKTVQSRLPRLATLNRLTILMGEMAVIESRLSVLGRPAMPSDNDFSAILAERAVLIDHIGFFIQIDGPDAGTFAQRLGALLTAQGYRLVESSHAAAGLISGKIRMQPLALENPNVRFVRALADISMIDLDTRKEMAAFSENVRKGHMDKNEAQRRAIDQLAEQTAAKLIQTLGAVGLAPVNGAR